MLHYKKSIMKKIFFAILITIIAIAGCKKSDDLGEAPRLFRPVIKDQLESNGNWIKASWQAVKGSDSYTAQLSKDTFRTVTMSVTLDTNVILFENLAWEQLYQVRVRANSTDTTQNSKFSDLGAIKTARFPTILNIPALSEVNDNSVKVSWKTEGATVTRIQILKASDSSVLKDVTLSPTDVTNAYKIISGLAASTPHIIFLYSGTTVRGWANFTTKSPILGNLIDLRDISGRPSVLQDTIPIIPSGSTIVLKRGEQYDMSNSSLLVIDKSLTFIGGTDLLVPEQPILYFTSNFNVTSGSAIDSLVFIDVTLRGSDYSGKYVLNISNACTIGKIRFQSCLAEIFRGVLRAQSQPVILGSFEIENSIVDSVSNYGVVNMDVASSKVDKIKLTNSTFYKVEKVITSTKPTAGSTSVLIDNCTFNEAPWGGGSNYIIDYGSTTVTNGITVNNSIFGIGKDKTGALNVRDVRASAGTTINASNNFRTSDHISAGSDLPSIVTYTRPSFELWQNPSAGNFKIIDNSFPGKANAGDPRWRP